MDWIWAHGSGQSKWQRGLYGFLVRLHFTDGYQR